MGKKVLVFASDLAPVNGLATSGGGLRSWQIIQGLRSRGFDVSFYMPEDAFLVRQFNNQIPHEIRRNFWRFDNQDEIIARENPDVVVFTRATAIRLKEDPGVPMALDFHGPAVMEDEQKFGSAGQDSKRISTVNTKIQGIQACDFFTCAGRRQRAYFTAFLLLAGVKMSDMDIKFMPVAMPPEMPVHEADREKRCILFAGGFYPWLNPMPGLLSLADALRTKARGRLEIYGGSHKINQKDIDLFEEGMSKLKENPRVEFKGYVSRAELMDRYRSAYAAFELMPWNPERELAFTTRTVEYLWAGLPVIYNDYAELSEMIAEYDAGWLTPPSDRNALAAVVDRIMNDPEEVRRKSSNAQRLVGEKLTYDKVIEPLAAFCANPYRRDRSDCGAMIAGSPPAYENDLLFRAYAFYRTAPRREFLRAVENGIRDRLNRWVS